MRLDDYLSTVGIVKRRTVAKELGVKGRIEVNGNRAKPSYQVRVNDIIAIKGNHPILAEVLSLPQGSVAREDRSAYYRELPLA